MGTKNAEAVFYWPELRAPSRQAVFLPHCRVPRPGREKGFMTGIMQKREVSEITQKINFFVISSLYYNYYDIYQRRRTPGMTGVSGGGAYLRL
ncbi:MAG: hypothetical protein WCW52_00515 [Elusimicrobiales bacterium]|jgi:hypothetical protein